VSGAKAETETETDLAIIEEDAQEVKMHLLSFCGIFSA
jgi:hypothetical protein